MLARLLRLHPSTYKRLVRLGKEAERDGAYRVARRLQAVVLNSEGQTSGELARILKAPRSKVSEWLQRYQTEGVDGLLEGYRSGRPSQLTEKQQQQLGDIVDSGPVAYGLDNGIWTSPMIAWVIEEEFGVQYHPGHVRKLLDAWGFSVQRPRRILARADVAAQDRWRRRIYPNLKKKPKRLGTDLHRRSQLSAGLDSARYLEPRGLPSRSSGYRRAQEREDPRSHRAVAHAVRLSTRHRLQRLHLPRLPRTTGPALSPPGGHPDSGQRLLPQGRRRVELVQRQPALAGGASVAALLARVESHRTAMAAHAQERDAQSFLHRPGRLGRHIDARLRRDAVTPAIHQFLPNSFLLIHMSL